LRVYSLLQSLPDDEAGRLVKNGLTQATHRVPLALWQRLSQRLTLPISLFHLMAFVFEFLTACCKLRTDSISPSGGFFGKPVSDTGFPFNATDLKFFFSQGIDYNPGKYPGHMLADFTADIDDADRVFLVHVISYPADPHPGLAEHAFSAQDCRGDAFFNILLGSPFS